MNELEIEARLDVPAEITPEIAGTAEIPAGMDAPAELAGTVDSPAAMEAQIEPAAELKGGIEVPAEMEVMRGPEGPPGRDGKDGRDGRDGEPGTPGAPGADGVSPILRIEDIPGGHRLTITDASGSHSMDIMDGAKGQTGPAGPGVPTGGSSGQVLKKASDTDYDGEWADEADPVFAASAAAGIDATDIQNWDGKYPGMVSITSGSADMNDYKTAGIYYFSSGATLTNVPNSAVNGWLVVLQVQPGGAAVKQIWLRGGSNPTTFRDEFFRLYNSGEWGDWIRGLTEKDLSSSTPVKDSASGAVGTDVTAARSDHSHPLNVDTTAPANLAAAAAAGSAATYARRDHVHKWPTPANIGAVSTSEESTSTTVTMSASGYTFTSIVCRKYHGIVFFEFTVEATTAPANNTAVTVATLPSGYRPPFTVRQRAVGLNGTDSIFNTSISTAGAVSLARTPKVATSARFYVVFPSA